MGVLTRLVEIVRGRPNQPGEADAPAGLDSSPTRATGGEPDPAADDTHSTTGTTESGPFVGRASGDDAGDVGVSGAEARAQQRDAEPEPDEPGTAEGGPPH